MIEYEPEVTLTTRCGKTLQYDENEKCHVVDFGHSVPRFEPTFANHVHPGDWIALAETLDAYRRPKQPTMAQVQGISRRLKKRS